MKFSEELLKMVIEESGMETPLDSDDVEYIMQSLWEQLDEHQGNIDYDDECSCDDTLKYLPLFFLGIGFTLFSIAILVSN